MLKCKKSITAWWGSILTPDKIYPTQPYQLSAFGDNKSSLILDSDNYYHYISLIAHSLPFLEQGYTPDNLPEVIPGYLKNDVVNSRYTLKIELDYVNIQVDDNTIYNFITTTKKELIEEYGSCEFNSTTYFLEDYFIDIQEERDIKLKLLGI